MRGTDSGYWERFERTEAEIPNPLVIVFCRICGMAEMAADQWAAAQRVLLEVCEAANAEAASQVFSIHSSVYGRLLCCKHSAAALDTAQYVLNTAASKGVSVAIGVATGGRVERVRDLGMSNLIGVPINLAARLAALEAARLKIAVTPEVANAAEAEAARYRGKFSSAEAGKVKRTDFIYQWLHFKPDQA